MYRGVTDESGHPSARAALSILLCERAEVVSARGRLRRARGAFRRPLFDLGGQHDVILVAGMGRSGTTWLASLINCDDSYRILFEPFHPEQVEAARKFQIMQYMRPETDDSELEGAARAIMRGDVRGEWIDRDNRRMFYRRRIVKDIRCNLMLGWLRKIAGDAPVVLTLRHPLQIALSWTRLGWGRYESIGQDDLEIILSQQAVHHDFPLIDEVLSRTQPRSFAERVVFHWCVYYLVPLHHLRSGEAHVTFYEGLILNPDHEVQELMRYLGKSIDAVGVSSALSAPSSTNFLERNFALDRQALVSGWRQAFSKDEIRRANDILVQFGLDEFYDAEGLPALRPVFS
jgi:Sulfotransferase family